MWNGIALIAYIFFCLLLAHFVVIALKKAAQLCDDVSAIRTALEAKPADEPSPEKETPSCGTPS